MTVKTNERPGTRAVLRHCRMSGYKAREVLDLVRGLDYTRAVELLDHTDRAAAPVVAKLLRSAASNAEHNDGQFPEELYIASCFADEGPTLKRFRPRARGRSSRILKRTCHITIILSRMPEAQIARLKARSALQNADRRARRVAGARRRARAVEAVEAAEEGATVAEEGVEESAAEEDRASRPRKAAPAKKAAKSPAKAPAKAAPAKKVPAKKAPAKAAPAKKAAVKAAPAKKVAVKAAPAKKAVAPRKTARVIARIGKKTTRRRSGKDES
jgi:large subunit ribosomal protein L22